MHDFSFHNPTRILFEKGAETKIGEELQRAGVRTVLFVYGSGSIRQSGLYDTVCGALKNAGVAWHEHDGVVSNPTLEHAREGIKVAKSADVDAVLCVGGGSVIDEGKAIAVGALDGGDVWEYYTGKPVKAALPVYTILTIAAAGSEMNGNSVLTNTQTQQKYSFNSLLVYPTLSILNPELTRSVSRDYSVYGAVDAIAHVIEGYFTQRRGARIQDRLCESIILSVMEAIEVIVKNPDDYDARAEMMWSATLALNGLPVAGLEGVSFPNHLIEHSLSALYNIPHGAGLSIVIPAWMQWYRTQNPERFERFARQIFGKDTAQEGVEALKGWFASIGSPVTLEAAGIPADAIDKIAENAAQTAKAWGMADPYTQEVITDILQLAR